MKKAETGAMVANLESEVQDITQVNEVVVIASAAWKLGLI